MAINIMETFYSIQGEGTRTGVPSVFVRTGLCNFRCQGFGVEYTDPSGEVKYGCDSYYSVDPKFSKTWDMYTNYQDLIDRIDQTVPRFSKRNLIKPDIVFTGGEPLIYWDDDQYQRLLEYYISRGHKVTIETNGALDIEFTRKYQKDIIFSTSVKLSNSGEPKIKRIKIDNLTNILENTDESYFKFVIQESTWSEDYEEIKEILNNIPTYVPMVYLMPLGDTKESLQKNSKFVFEKAMELGFMYSDRIHIRVFDNEPGV
jgi:organic radical activating enzyme